MEDEEQASPNGSSQPSQPTERSQRPSHGAAQAVGPALDARGEALLQRLPGPLAVWEPEVTAILDEVVVAVSSQHIPEAAQALRETPDLSFDYLRCLSVVDYEESFQVVYHLWSREHRHKLTLKTNIPYDDPKAPSVIGVWPAADWFEREGHDLFGVVFEGHPGLKPLLLWEGFEGYPGRKAFPFHEYTEY